MAVWKPRRTLLSIWRIYLILAALIPAFLISLIFDVFTMWWLILSGGWLLAFIVLYALLLPMELERKSFLVEKERIVATGGVLYHFEHALPYGNIQYVSVLAGPLERLFHICTVVVVAAGGRMVLSGIGKNDGLGLVSVLTEYMREGKA